MRALTKDEQDVLLVDFDSLGGYVNTSSQSTFPKTYYNEKKPRTKLKLKHSTKWPGLYFYETMGRGIKKGEEVFGLYSDEGNLDSQDIDDANEANEEVNDDDYDNDDENDASVSTQDFK
jgi:Ran GTPase-activating protein (RanGAP) involved in mRNA processing and transport